MKSKNEVIEYADFIQMLTAEFPEVPQAFDEYGKGLLHCEMGAFARLTEEAMDKGKHWQAEQYFRFVDRIRKHASPYVENAIDVSYLESLAFSEMTENRYTALKRMPKSLRVILLEFDARWA